MVNNLRGTVRRWLSAAALLLVCVLMVKPGAAQDDFPAYLALNGHLYRWTPAQGLVRESACDTPDTRIMRLSASPDGRYLALNMLREGSFMEGGAPTPHGDLYWCDPLNDILLPLTEGNADNTSVSQRGVWSPDGTQLAWAEVNADFESVAIRTYEPGTAAPTTLVESTPLDTRCGMGPTPPELIWASAGIAVTYWLSSEADVCIPERLGIYIYDPESGARIADLPVGTTGGYVGLEAIAWDAVSGDRLMVSQDNEPLQIVTLSGQVSPTQGAPEMYLPATGEAIRTLLPFDAQTVGIAPDGSAALLLIETNLYTVIDGEVSVIDLTTVEPVNPLLWGQDVTWGRLEARLSEDAGQTGCAVRPIVYVDDPARVIEGLGANNLRLAPFSGAAVIGQIPEGSLIDVVFRTSVCTGDVVWRYVRFEGMTGWTAESQGGTLFLERVTG